MLAHRNIFARILPAFIIISLSSFASACEGQCIVKITQAFIGNYTAPVHSVLDHLATQISTKLLPPGARPQDPMTLLEPVLTAYADVSYNALETAIFPSYFHGKCQRFSKDGQDPPGCPNPDCPVVCGTPGSMVHFYSMLRFIAWDNTRSVFEALMEPGSKTFAQVEQRVKDAQLCGGAKKMCKRKRAVPIGVAYGHLVERAQASGAGVTTFFTGTHGQAGIAKRASSDLSGILSHFGPLFEQTCGGAPNNSTEGLPRCSWEAPMKAYILSFP